MDPAYENDVPMESEEDYQRALDGHAHVAERVALDFPGRHYACAKCGAPLYAVPVGYGGPA